MNKEFRNEPTRVPTFQNYSAEGDYGYGRLLFIYDVIAPDDTCMIFIGSDLRRLFMPTCRSPSSVQSRLGLGVSTS